MVKSMAENDDIKVNDKRRFTMTDDSDAGRDSTADEGSMDEGQDSTGDTGDTKRTDGQAEGTGNTNFKISFMDLINSLAGTTLIQLGAVADPQTNIIKKDLGAAKQTIDILELLKEKTAGNLTNDESMMLDNVLFDLRMRYVLVSEGKK